MKPVLPSLADAVAFIHHFRLNAISELCGF